MRELIIQNQKSKIYNSLVPLIGEKTILLDCPYHINIGDTLIWQGELDFLNSINKNPISQHSEETFNFRNLEKNITICLHGGGNFGDLYRTAQDFRIKVIRNYPNNRIIMFPQSVWYEDETLIQEDGQAFKEHKDLYLCARDIYSYNFMKNWFPHNNILLVPDMAFYIDKEKLKLKPRSDNSIIDTVLVERLDKENIGRMGVEIPIIDEVHDWPTFERIPLSFKIIGRLLKIIEIWPFSRFILGKSIDRIMVSTVKDRQIRKGINFISRYQNIYTTRLHAMILGILLNKRIIVLDNVSGKLSAYYQTWLKEDSRIELVK